jgi:hypothetical protein
LIFLEEPADTGRLFFISKHPCLSCHRCNLLVLVTESYKTSKKTEFGRTTEATKEKQVSF